MIRRLEQAGLGYHTQANQTTDKLGEIWSLNRYLFGIGVQDFMCIERVLVTFAGQIPMRQLVYRVHALPQSLLPLVWDFGQLNADVERLYIKQIVNRYVSTILNTKQVLNPFCGMYIGQFYDILPVNICLSGHKLTSADNDEATDVPLRF